MTITHYKPDPGIPRHPGGTIWMTGLPGSGKTTLSMNLGAELNRLGFRTFVLDGDILRQTLNADLGFSPQDRRENIRRASEVAALLASAGIIVIAAFISPYREDRERVRTRQGFQFHEIWLSTAAPVCEARDPKGLYARARQGKLPEFTGISAPYEIPLAPDLILDTGQVDIDTCIRTLVDYVISQFK